MTDRELLQQALDALISVWNSDRTTRQVETIRAIKARLAQPEPEPVAWVNLNALTEQINSVNCGTVYRLPSEAEGRQPLYTAPPQRERIVFPTMLRKMWSGTEVQAWLDENVNKEKNND